MNTATDVKRTRFLDFRSSNILPESSDEALAVNKIELSDCALYVLSTCEHENVEKNNKIRSGRSM
jgi:hypothetical protein